MSLHQPDQKTEQSDTTLSGKITDVLREEIVRGIIKPGTKLNESALSKKHNVSRGPLREAINRLVSMGLITYIPHQGASVITLEIERIIDLYEIREVLEGKAAALAAKKMTADEVSNLKKLMLIHADHYKSNQGKYMQSEGDFDFHFQVIKGSRNSMLIKQLCDELYHLIRMFRHQTSLFKSRSDKALQEHQHILYAIEQKDEALAETAMRSHIKRAKESIMQHTTNAPLNIISNEH